MTEFLEEDSKEIYSIHKEAAEDLASSEAEVREAGQALADARVNYRRSDGTDESHKPVEVAQERFVRAKEVHGYSLEEYPSSVAEGREYYEDNQDALNEQAVKDAKVAGVDTSFGTAPKK